MSKPVPNAISMTVRVPANLRREFKSAVYNKGETITQAVTALMELYLKLSREEGKGN